MAKEIPLCELPFGVSASVTDVKCGKNLVNRIYDFGITAGSEITPVYKSPFGDPTAYLIKNTLIALRAKDAKNIFVSVGG